MKMWAFTLTHLVPASLALASLALSGLPAAALAAGQGVTLRNRTGYEIEEIHLSRSGAGEEGGDLLGDGVLADGGSKTLPLKTTGKTAGGACRWKMRVVFADTEKVEWPALDLCSVHTITLRYKNGETTAETR